MPDHFYVYPAYLRKDNSRTDGRRVPNNLAAAEVTAEELVTAAKSLGFSAAVESDKHYPRESHRYGGRVKVTKKKGVSKSKFLQQLAAQLLQREKGGEKE